MPSYRTLIARSMAEPGIVGSNARRIAEGATTFGEAEVGDLGTKGSWFRRLAEGAGLTEGRGSWARRLMAGTAVRSGSWDEQIHASEALVPDE